jgi:hypothetical protein
MSSERDMANRPDHRSGARHELPPSRSRTDKPPPRGSQPTNVLLWLSKHKGKSGRALIGPAAFAAGERLKADMALAHLVPSTTMRWSQTQHVDVSRSTGGLNPTDAAIAARQRMNQALEFVGPELSGILVDLCGFDKGIEAIESERQWPARSGKLVLRLALDCLARHYGYSDTAHGAARRITRTWRDTTA